MHIISLKAHYATNGELKYFEVWILQADTPFFLVSQQMLL